MATRPGVLTRQQLAQLWVQAGGNPHAAGTAAAIALAESSGRVGALNASGQDYSVGPWQINYYGNLRGPRTRQFGTPEQLRADPLANARAAVAISGGGKNFSPWTTYTSGAYKNQQGGGGGGAMGAGVQQYAQNMLPEGATISINQAPYENASTLRELDQSPIEASSHQAHSQFALSLINANKLDRPQSVEGMLGAIMQLRSDMKNRTTVADNWSGHSDAHASIGPTTITVQGSPAAQKMGSLTADQSVSVPTGGPGPRSADFFQRVDALQKAVGNLHITSGYRSVGEQTKLWNDALNKYGSPEAARKWVAPPGHSNHNKGIAADLAGNLSAAHQMAAKFGLTFPMSWEPWHVEPIGARG